LSSIRSRRTGGENIAYGRKKWSPGFALGYRVGFRRGFNGAKRAPGAYRIYNGQRRRYEFRS
jgi:hypothetical protein